MDTIESVRYEEDGFWYSVPKWKYDIYVFYNIPIGDLRALMEATKKHCGWTEGAANYASAEEMLLALKNNK